MSVDDDSDPYERYSVNTVAGQAPPAPAAPASSSSVLEAAPVVTGPVVGYDDDDEDDLYDLD